jgi:hypothetical protein
MEMAGRIARRAGGLAGVIALLLAGVALAAAGGRGTVTETQHSHNEVFFSFKVQNPCTGEPGTLTAIATNSVFHVTFFETSDEFWVTGTGEGTVTFTPENREGVSASGHFAAWFGQSSNNKNEVEHNTNTVQLVGTNGSHVVIHATSHTSINAKGVVTVSFEKFSFHCG